MNTPERLRALRQQMRAAGVHAYLVPGTDPHQSEYLPACWQRREWLSGFSGSAGDVLVTRRAAGLWTDGRYFLQAERELQGSGIELHRLGQPGVPGIEEYLAAVLRKGQRLGIDARSVSMARAGALERALGVVGAAVQSIDDNLVDLIWTDRPALPAQPVRAHGTRFSGESVADKLTRLRAAMAERGASAHVVTMLDAIAWLFNLRGSDVDYNPVAIAYALITAEAATLFIDAERLEPAALRQLGEQVTLRPYARFGAALKRLARPRARVWVDSDTASRWVTDRLAGAVLVTGPSPIMRMKARKNATELAGVRAAHERDGVAMVRFLAWLDDAVPRGGVTEMAAAERLAALRAEGEHFQGLSFRTISGYAEHGAIIHYSVTPQTDVELRPRGLYLLDSGGQYLDGTTDITRTVLLGARPSVAEREAYTRVLKGHIALARARFPQGATGARLDTLARQFLWQAGLDYGHGTGHGVGAYLNVHEGPQSISPRGSAAALEIGNIQSNEPGYYAPGAFGVRIENLVEVVEVAGLGEAGHTFLGFDTLTVCPIDTRPLAPALLDAHERRWLNDYHRRVHKTLAPHLGRAERRWLKGACQPL